MQSCTYKCSTTKYGLSYPIKNNETGGKCNNTWKERFIQGFGGGGSGEGDLMERYQVEVLDVDDRIILTFRNLASYTWDGRKITL
jgi:hypothetical protein